MKQLLINQCDFCEKTSFSKNYLKQHEGKCFYNPATHSCASCLWFSRVHGFVEKECYLRKIQIVKENERQVLKTKCKSWKNAAIVKDIDLFEGENEIINRLLEGDWKFFKPLAKGKNL